MKKTLLLLAFLFTIVINAQPPVTPPPFQVCDDNNDGFAVFDLTGIIPMLGINHETTTVTFHETEADAQIGGTTIPTPTAYVNITPNNQVIFLRIFDSATNETSYLSIILIVYPTPMASPASLSFCDPTELAIYDLNAATPQILGDPPPPATNVTFYPTLADAQAGTNAIISPYIPMSNIDIVFARVENLSGGCFATTQVVLYTNVCDTTCHLATDIHFTNVSGTSLTVNWTGFGTFTRVMLLPLGLEPPTQGGPYIDVMAPNTSVTFTGLNPYTCYSVFIKKYCSISPPQNSDWTAGTTVCTNDCAASGSCNEVLYLNAFIDSNNNGIKDSGEMNFNHGNFVYQVNDSGSNSYGTANQGWYYIFESNPSNSYDISFSVGAEFSAYYASAATYSNITLPNGSGITYLYFPITITSPYNDVQVYLNNQNNPRPGFIYSLNIAYTNNGLGMADGTLTFTKDPNLTISSVYPSGSVSTPTGFTYDFTNLAPNEHRYIQVNLQVPTIPTVSIGQLVTNSVSIATSSDYNLSNNQATFIQAITGSYDPNDKAEAHGGKIGLDTFTSNDYLYYTIRFENTGNASTEFIRVEDALDSQLDETTFEMIGASHAVNTRRNGNQLTWNFYDTQIPPTSIDPQNSHGYVSFKIKPKPGYAIGDIIPNTASIYFDYNPAIVTNTFNTEFFETLGNATFNASMISVFPNPASNLVTVFNNSTENISKISIYEITGKKVYTTNNVISNMSIDVSGFSKGVYLIEIASEDNVKITKKLILN